MPAHRSPSSKHSLRRATLWSAAAALAATAGACASSAGPERPLPQWFVEQQDALEAEGYPRLENVPDRVDATVDQGHWDEVTRELDEAGRQMQADRRSTPVNRTPAAQDVRAQRFDERAREEIAATRRQLGLPPREEDATTEDPAEAPADPAAAPAAQDPSTTPDE